MLQSDRHLGLCAVQMCARRCAVYDRRLSSKKVRSISPRPFEVFEQVFGGIGGGAFPEFLSQFFHCVAPPPKKSQMLPQAPFLNNKKWPHLHIIIIIK